LPSMLNVIFCKEFQFHLVPTAFHPIRWLRQLPPPR
jgi:hypothetical protein